jgi:hypothetical protein
MIRLAAFADKAIANVLRHVGRYLGLEVLPR